MDGSNENPPIQPPDPVLNQSTVPAPPVSPEAPPAPPPPTPKPKRILGKKGLIGIMVTLLVIGAGGYFGLVKKSPTSSTKVYHVGILNALDFFSATTDGFKQKMTELGYVEGKNIVYDVQKAAAPVGNQKIIEKFVSDKVDLIFVYPTEASLEAKEGTKGTGIPVVMAQAGIEGNTLVDSIQKPGGNVTGIRFPAPEIGLKRLELLHQLAPNAKRFWVPYLKDYPTVAPALEVMRPQAKTLDVTLVETPFTSPAELEAYINARPASGDIGFDAVLQIAEPLSAVTEPNDAVFKFADANKLPVCGALVLDQDFGPIFSIFPNSLEVGKLAAPLADKIFKGASPGILPVITPESDFSVNYKVIQKLGLTIDDGLLSTAIKIIR